MTSILRLLRSLVLGVAIVTLVAGCSTSLRLTNPIPTPALTATPTPTPTPTPTRTPPPAFTPTPEPPPPPTPPNAMGGQTDGGNTPNTPLVEDTGPQQFAVGSAKQLNDDEFRYVVAQDDQVLAIASRFDLQVTDVVRVNFRCSDPLVVQPGDVLDIRWPVDSERVGFRTGSQAC